MKILNVIAQKPGETGSGVYLNEIIKQFALKGHEQAVVAGITAEDKAGLVEFYNHIPGPNGSEVSVPFYPVLYNSVQIPFPVCGMSDEMPYESTRYCDMNEDMVCQMQAGFCYQVDRAIEALEPDVIICHHLYLLTATISSVFPDQNIVGICHNTDIRQMKKHDLLKNFITFEIGRLQHVFVPQQSQYDQVMEIFDVKPEKMHLLGMGFNYDIFHPEEGSLSSASSIASDFGSSTLNAESDSDSSTLQCKTLKLCYAGKIAEKKGLFALLHALDLLSTATDPHGQPYTGITLTCAGGAGNEAEYKAIVDAASKCKCQVTFTGKLSQPELADLYRASDIFVLPSYYEGIPLVAVEALACGCKVLISDIPGVKDWLDGAVSNATISYVTLPTLKNEDEPVYYELPAYEERIAEGIKDLAATPNTKADVSRISWEGIADKILDVIA